MILHNHMYTCPLKECMVKSISTLIQLSLSLSSCFLSLFLSLLETNSKPRNKGKKSRKEASLTRFSGTKSFQFQLVSTPQFSFLVCDIFHGFEGNQIIYQHTQITVQFYMCVTLMIIDDQGLCELKKSRKGKKDPDFKIG